MVYGGADFTDILDIYNELFIGKVSDKINEADTICQHIFDILGSGPKKLSQEGKGYQAIDWHRDFKSGFRWNPNIFYRNIRYGHVKGLDIIVPWELSRFQHLHILGEAYVLTKNKKYAEEFKEQIADWIINNSLGFGVNWSCTMSVAIRAANWLVAMEYFSDANLFSRDFLNMFYTSIYEHAKFIRSHLEHTIKFSNNLYIANIAGLFFISTYCPFFKESKRWKRFALGELTKEIERQVYPDGCDFEASTSYHRFVLEMLFYCELLGKRAGIEFPTGYQAKVNKMFEFCLYCIKPNGWIPQIGDNDNGRFFIFSKRLVLEYKYLLSLAAIYYKKREFKILQFDFDEEALWVFGLKGKIIYDGLLFRSEPIISRAFPDSGWYIIRHNNNYCFIACGPNGQNGVGGHAHNDKLSFELMLDKQDVIVDAGTYAYTPYPEERNKFRSVEYHNTVRFDGFEQNKLPKKNMFILPDKVKIKYANLEQTDTAIYFQGEIQYNNIKHKRMITIDKKSENWQIIDSFSGKTQISKRLLFHLPPHLKYEGGCIFSIPQRRKIAYIETSGHCLGLGEYEYSAEYGSKIKAQYLFIDIHSLEMSRVLETHIRIL
jgi:hypothetical protein